jgi:hypothetical protein
MEEEIKAAEIDSRIRYSALALFDEVRMAYFRRFEDCLNFYIGCINYLSDGKVPSKYMPNFISRVIALYVEIAPKIEYIKNKELEENLKKIEKYRGGEFTADLKLIPPSIEKKFNNEKEKESIALFLEFGNYLFALRTFMELDGITKYEQAKYDPAEAVIRGYVK